MPMLRQSIVEYGKPLCETVVEPPVPEGTQVLVRVHHCGVCHSDLHLRDGHFDIGHGKQLDVTRGRALPFTLGHEIAGEVAALGPEAEGVAIGARRVVYPWIGCGACETCAEGEEHLCNSPRQLGIQVDGGYASHVMVPHPRYLLDAAGIAPALAGALMCSGLTAFSALKRLGALARRGPVLIVGLGGVGMMGLAFARLLGLPAPIVADVSEAKRTAALAAGAAAAFDPTDAGARKALLKQTGGVHGAVDFAGAESSLNFAQGALRKGGKAIVVGLIGGSFEMPIPYFPMRAIGIEGSYVGSLGEAREMLDLVRRGPFAAIPLAHRPLGEAEAALADLAAGRVVGRVILDA